VANAACTPPLQDMAQTAWNYMNDALRTNVFIRFDASTIACACLELAATTHGASCIMRVLGMGWRSASRAAVESTLGLSRVSFPCHPAPITHPQTSLFRRNGLTRLVYRRTT
jgi:hypothetical protein